MDILIGQKKRPKDYWVTLKEWLNFLGDYSIYSQKAEKKFLSCQMIDASNYMAWQRKQKGGACTVKYHPQQNLRSNATIIKRVDILKHFYNINMQLGFIDYNPFALIKKPSKHVAKKQPTRAVTLEQVGQMLDKCPESEKGLQAKAFISLMAGGGLRRSEVLNLRLCDVFDTSVFLRDTKTGRDYHQEINLALLAFVHEWKTYRSKQGAIFNDLLFTVSESTLARTVKVLGQKINIQESISPHSLRATFATGLLDAGVPPNEVAFAMRHASLQSTMAYDKRKLSGEANSVNKLIFKNK